MKNDSNYKLFNIEKPQRENIDSTTMLEIVNRKAMNPFAFIESSNCNDSEDSNLYRFKNDCIFIAV